VRRSQSVLASVTLASADRFLAEKDEASATYVCRSQCCRAGGGDQQEVGWCWAVMAKVRKKGL
jgi:hypothetical protein